MNTAVDSTARAALSVSLRSMSFLLKRRGYAWLRRRASLRSLWPSGVVRDESHDKSVKLRALGSTGTVSDARHASDTARLILVGVRQCPTRVGRARQRCIRRVSGVRHCSGPHRVGFALMGHGRNGSADLG